MSDPADADPGPYRAYRRLRESAPVCRTRAGFWLITDYYLVRAGLADRRLANDLRHYRFYAEYVEARGGTQSPAWRHEQRWLALLDGTDHQRLRRFADQAFAAQLTPALATFMATAAARTVGDALDRGVADFMAEIAHPFTVEVPIP